MTTDTAPTADARAEEMKSYLKVLRSTSKADLRDQVSRTHRVVDLNRVDKASLISMLLCARFGRKAVLAVFG